MLLNPKDVTRKSGTNFYYAFLILPEAKRRAIFALYSFCRIVDDCVDEATGSGAAGLDSWLEEIHATFRGSPRTSVGQELAWSLERFPMPLQSFEEIVEGCRMDLTIRRYRTDSDLEVYCHRVASAVGLAAIEIFGYRDPRTKEYASCLGVALQLTNILRDVGVDGRAGRLYVPEDAMARFGVDPDALLRHARGEADEPAGLGALLRSRAEGARARHAQAAALLPKTDRVAMVPAEVMRATYHALLDEVVRRGFPLTGDVVRLGAARKLFLAGRILLGSYF
jgi:phytoene synthase